MKLLKFAAPDSVKVSVYSNGAGSSTPSYTFAINEVPVDSYITSPDFQQDGIQMLRLSFGSAPVYDSNDNLDVPASIYGSWVSIVQQNVKMTFKYERPISNCSVSSQIKTHGRFVTLNTNTKENATLIGAYQEQVQKLDVYCGVPGSPCFS